MASLLLNRNFYAYTFDKQNIVLPMLDFLVISDIINKQNIVLLIRDNRIFAKRGFCCLEGYIWHEKQF